MGNRMVIIPTVMYPRCLSYILVPIPSVYCNLAQWPIPNSTVHRTLKLYIFNPNCAKKLSSQVYSECMIMVLESLDTYTRHSSLALRGALSLLEL